MKSPDPLPPGSLFGGYYSRHRHHLQQCLGISAITLMLAGCGSVNIPLPSFAAIDKTANEQTAAAGVVVQEPIPETLAYSDATAIGTAAANDLLGAVTAEDVDWENDQTGSTGTIVAISETSLEGEDTCRSFGATVISMLGIHRYFGKACQGAEGMVVESIETAGADPTLSVTLPAVAPEHNNLENYRYLRVGILPPNSPYSR
jgi:surface antigen